jgi:hypothetical protein
MEAGAVDSEKLQLAVNSEQLAVNSEQLAVSGQKWRGLSR